MVGELETYTLNHFMPMTPEVYLRLFERLNGMVWPWQLLALALVAGAAEALRRGHSGVAGVLIGLCWIWVALAFQFSLHAELIPSGLWLGWAFVLQALLLIFAGWRGQLVWQSGPRAAAGLALLAFAVLLYPLIGPFTGRSWAAFEVAGTAPDPTLMATLALLLMTPRMPWLLLPIPLVALFYSALVWSAMDWRPGLVAGIVAVLFLPCVFIGTQKRRDQPTANKN